MSWMSDKIREVTEPRKPNHKPIVRIPEGEHCSETIRPYIPAVWAKWFLTLPRGESPFAPKYIRRSWRERLFSRPWRPLEAYRIVWPAAKPERAKDRVQIRARPDIKTVGLITMTTLILTGCATDTSDWPNMEPELLPGMEPPRELIELED